MTSQQSPGNSTLERALLALEKMERKLAAAERAKYEPLAIVGMACRFPGSVVNPSDLWQLLHAGRDAVTEVPAHRWNQSTSAPHPAARWAGTLNEIDQFDGAFFGLGRNEVADMDPQHRLLLEVAWEALEDAGIPPDRLSGTKTGVFVGIASHDYANLLTATDTSSRAYVPTGNAGSFAAGRIAYLLGLQGPCMSVDTACSSSLVALHLACQSLRRGECDIALVGGANLLLAPDISTMLASLQILSPDGRCRTFDARANGYVRSEGVGLLVLERFSDAQRRNDRIWGLVRGSATNQNGRATSLTAPNLQAQVAVVRAALEDARVKPEQIGYVEVHSNGSPFGDPVELDALREVMGKPRAGGSTCVLGSVKTFIGHAEAASSMASLVKAVLVLNHETIPRNLHFETLNPNASLEGTPFVIPNKEVTWNRTDMRRLAGVSATGLSGTNAHAVLEEPPQIVRDQDKPERPVHVFLLSGKTAEALRDRARQMLRHLAAHPELSLGDQCHTLSVGRSHFEYRFAAVVGSAADVIGQLTDYVDGASSAYRTGRIENLSARRRMAFVFSGTAAQAIGVLGSIHTLPPVFAEALRRGDDAAHALIGRHVISLLETDTRIELPDDAIDDELALFVLQCALVELWRSWGIEPSVVAGEGTGECAAAWAAGALDFATALALAAARAQFVKSNGRDVDELTRVVSRLSTPTSKRTFFASIGTNYSIASIGTIAYWQAQRTTAADFVSVIAQLPTRHCTACIEIGPRPILSAKPPAVRDAVPMLPSMRPRIPLIRTLLETLAALYALGFEINWESFDAPHPYRRISLPTYPFQRQRYWFGGSATTKAEPANNEGHPLLGRILEARADRPDIRVWEAVLGDAHHQAIGVQYVFGTPVVSSGGLVQIACAAAREMFANTSWELNLMLSDPPALHEDTPTTMQVIATPESETKATLGIFFRTRQDGSWRPVARGVIQPTQYDEEDEDAAPPSMRPGRRQVVAQALWERRLEAFGVDAEVFRIEQLWRRDGETLAGVVLTTAHAAMAFARAAVAIASITHPAMHGRWWMIESIEGVATKPTGSNSRSWLRLNWNANDGTTARVSVELIDEEGIVAASARNVTLRAQDPAVVLRAAGKEPLEGAFVDLVWKESPLAPPAATTKRKWIVLTDAGGVGIALAVLLQASGDTVITLPAAALRQQIDLLDLVLTVSGPFYGVVHLGALDSPASEPPTLTAIDEGLRRGVMMAQIVVDRLASQSHVPRLWFVTRGAQPVGEEPQSIAQAGLWGFGRVLSIERPDMWGGMIDLDPRAYHNEANEITQILAAMGGEDHLALRKGKFYVARLARISMPGSQVAEVRPDKSYLVTGARTPLGAAVAHWLADHGASTLILAHRETETNAAATTAWGASNDRDELQRTLEQRGLKVITTDVDISADGALQGLVSQSSVPLGGIVHAAGAVDDGIRRLTGADAIAALKQTLPAKSQTLWALHSAAAAAETPLDLFVTFTSVPSWLGWEGLGTDACFSEVMGAMARNRRRNGQAGTNVCLSFPNESRPGARSVDHELLAGGFQGMPMTLSLQAMERVMTHGQPVAMASWADWDLFEQTQRARGNRALFASITEGRRVRTGAVALQRRIAAADPNQAQRMVETIVRGEIARVLGANAVDIISNQQELASFGMDSIMAVQVLTSIGAVFGVTLPAATLLLHPSIEALSLRIVQTIQRSHQSPGAEHVSGVVSRRGLLLELASGGPKPPFFLAPPLTGAGMVFQTLAEHLSKDRPFYTFTAPGVDNDMPPCDRIETLAARFLEAVRQVQPRGPYRLGGYSIGSLVAYEMAQMLTRSGERVDILIIGDLPPSRVHVEDPSPFRVLAQFVGLPLDDVDLEGLASEEQVARMAIAVGNRLGLPPEVAESARQLRVYRAHLNALREYSPMPYHGRVAVITAHASTANAARGGYFINDPTFGWGQLCQQPVQVYPIAGDHFSILGMSASEMARVMDNELDAADAR